MADFKEPKKLVLSEAPKVEKLFNKIVDIQAWAAHEKNVWSWINEVQTPIMRSMRTFHNGLDSIYTRMASSAGQEELEKLFNDLSVHLQESIRSGVLISETPEGEFVLRLKEDHGEKEASGAINFLRGLAVPARHDVPVARYMRDTLDDQIRGFIRANNFKNGIPNASAHEKFLEKSVKSINEKATGLLKELNAGIETYKTDYGVHSENLNKLRTDLSSTIESSKIEADETVARLQERAKEIERVYSEKVQLQAPVQYFESQFKSHNFLSWVYLGVFTACAGGFLWGFYKFISFLFSSAQGMKDIEKYLLVAGFFTFGTWAVRILYKMFLNHQHLKTMAGEKGLLIKVYLSLLEKDSGLSKDDRALILAPLFRVPQNVFSKDDSASASPVEILLKTLHK